MYYCDLIAKYSNPNKDFSEKELIKDIDKVAYEEHNIDKELAEYIFQYAVLKYHGLGMCRTIEEFYALCRFMRDAKPFII